MNTSINKAGIKLIVLWGASLFLIIVWILIMGLNESTNSGANASEPIREWMLPYIAPALTLMLGRFYELGDTSSKTISITKFRIAMITSIIYIILLIVTAGFALLKSAQSGPGTSLEVVLQNSNALMAPLMACVMITLSPFIGKTSN